MAGGGRGGDEKVEVIIPLEQWPHDLAYASRSMSHGHQASPADSSTNFGAAGEWQAARPRLLT